MLTTTNPNALDKIVRKYFNNDSTFVEEKTEYNKIFDVYDATEYVERHGSSEGMTEAETIAENQDFPIGEVRDGWKAEFESGEVGKAITLSLKAQLMSRDNTLKLVRNIKEQKNQVIRVILENIEKRTHTMLNWGFNNNLDPTTNLTVNVATNTLSPIAGLAAQPMLAPDGRAIFDRHFWASTGNSFSNQLRDNPTVSMASIQDLGEYGASFLGADGEPMPMDFNKIIVAAKSGNYYEAKKIFTMANQMMANNVQDKNPFHGDMEICSSHYLINKYSWFAVAQPRISIGSGTENPLRVGIFQKPTLLPMRVERSNEAMRWNAYTSYKYGCMNLPFRVAGSNGSGLQGQNQ